MNARADAHDEAELRPIDIAALDGVVALERAAYAFPWTRGNFIDSIAAGYLMWQLVAPSAGLIGYFIAMAGVDEMHLLNITVDPAHQGRGHARTLLDALVAQARDHNARQLWLEVRASNRRAAEIYTHYGFRRIGVRKGYYPAPNRQREDAVVMSLDLVGALRAVD